MKKHNALTALSLSLALVLSAAGCSMSDDSKKNEPTITPNPDGTVTIRIEEGQNGLMSSNGNLKSETGKNASKDAFYESFPQAPNGPAQISYVVNTDTEGEYVLNVRYAFGGYCDYLRDAYIEVNGERLNIAGNENGVLEFAYTAKNWATWNDAKTTITLKPGDNSINIVAANGLERQTVASAGSWANLDSLATINNGDSIRGKVVSLPNIDYVEITSSVKNPVVKLSAGSSTSAYFNLDAQPENTAYGTVTKSAEGSGFKSGTEVTLTATPAAGYKFDCWHGDVVSKDEEFKVTVEKNIKVKARFIPANFNKATELAGLEGYATITSDDAVPYTITGGFGGTEHTISNLTELQNNKDKLSGSEPYIITLNARIGTSDNKSLVVNLGSNKTLKGVPGQDYGLKNISLKIEGSNIIVKDLHFGDVIADDFYRGEGNDAVTIKGGEHIWIDHCEFSSHLTPHDNAGTEINFSDYKAAGGSVDLEGESSEEEKWKKDFYDGLLDISNASRFISISNSYFHDHWKACLCGGTNDYAATQTIEHVTRLTFYNNYFKDVHSRQPLFRFGKAHIYSSYIEGVGNSTGVEVRAKSEVFVDNCCFEGMHSDARTVGCWNSSNGLGAGTWHTYNNTGKTNENYSGYASLIPYKYNPASAADSKANLPTTAGITK